MKKENLKVGNVIETREGKKYIVGVDHSRENKVARYLNDETMQLEYFNHLDEMYNDDLKAADDGVTRLDIVKVYNDMRSLVVDDITPIWERSPLDDLKYNSPIWVKGMTSDYYIICLFKGVDSCGRVIAGNHKEADQRHSPTWEKYKLFSAEDL